MYRVDVDIPYSDWPKHQDREALLKAASDAEEILDCMPTDPQGFLEAQVAILRVCLNASLEILTSPSEFHGYRLDEEAVPTIVEAFDHVVDALAAANIRFDRELHESVIRRHRAAIAAADDRFRSVLDRISSADLSTLQGGA